MELLKPFFIGGALALLLNFPLRFIEDRLPGKGRGKRALSLAVVFSLALAGTVILLSLIIPQLTASVSSLNQNLPAAWDSLRSWLIEVESKVPLLRPFVAKVENHDFEALLKEGMDWFLDGSGMMTGTVNMAAGMVNGTVDIAVGTVLAAYLLARKETLSREAKLLAEAWLPASAAKSLKEFIFLVGETFSAFLSGQCLEAFILGCVFAAFMWVCHFPCVALISIVIGITALVPVFGTFLGCAVGAVIVLALTPERTLWFLVLFICLQQLEGMCIYPRVVGNKVGLPPLWVLTAVTLGGKLFGAWGMLAMIPVFSVLYALVRKKTLEKLDKRKGKIF